MDALAGSPGTSLLVLAALGLVPFAFIATTSFVKLSVVLSLLRNALGTGQVPSGAVIAAFAAILTLYVMAPVGERMLDAASPALSRVDADAPFEGPSAAAVVEAFGLAAEPLRGFLVDNAGERERALFLELARDARASAAADDAADDDAADGGGDAAGDPAAVADDGFLVVLPAFLVTELAEAFLVGFLVFVPFLVVDMVVANILLALGMHMLSPTTISLPFKLLLFVLADGWVLLSRALVLSYG